MHNSHIERTQKKKKEKDLENEYINNRSKEGSSNLPEVFRRKNSNQNVGMRGVQKCVRGIVLFYVYEYYRVFHNSHIERTQKKERKRSGK